MLSASHVAATELLHPLFGLEPDWHQMLLHGNKTLPNVQF